MTSTGVAGLVAAASLAAVVSGGCARGAHDRVGDRVPPEPTVLTLAAGEAGPAARAWSAALSQISGGALRTAAPPTGAAATVGAVRRGEVDIAAVPARTLHDLGISSFDGLVAPLVVDSYALEAKLLRGPVAGRVLAGVKLRGVVGVAVLPGALEHVVADGKPLFSASDYRWGRFGVVPSEVTSATFRALGATARPLAPGGDSLPFDGVEQSLPEIVAHRYAFLTPGRAVALNAPLWPRVSVLVMNADAYRKLSPSRRALLSRAGVEAIAPAIDGLVREETGAIAVLCRPPHDDVKLFQLIWLTPSGRRSLRRAVRPVVRRLERDPAVRATVDAADALRPTVPRPTGVVCRGRVPRPFRAVTRPRVRVVAILHRTGRREWSSSRLTLRGDVLFRDRAERRVMSLHVPVPGGELRAWADVTVAPDGAGGHSWDGPGVVFKTPPRLRGYLGASVRFTGSTPGRHPDRIRARVSTDAPTGLR